MKERGTIDRLLEKFDPALFGALFLAALLLRLSALEAAPLTEREAAEAWGALQLLRGGSAASVSALYASLTAPLLFLAGPSHWAPRFFPALAGALAVFLPRLFLPARGRREAFLAAVLIALSPSLWISSTMAGGGAVGFLAAGFCIFYLRTKEPRPLTAGLALGLAAASGPAGWSGIAIAAVVLAADRLRRMRKPAAAEETGIDPFQKAWNQFARSPAGPGGFLLGLAAGGTGLLFFPRNLGALAAGFSDWLAAFFSGLPRAGEFFLLLVGYEPVALIFGAAGIVMLWNGLLSDDDRFWGRFAAVAAVWILIRPAAFPDEASWLILPLLILGAAALRSAAEHPLLKERPVFTMLLSGGVVALAAFMVFNLAAYESSGSWFYLILPLLLILGFLSVCFIVTGNWRRVLRQMLIGSSFALLGVFCLAQFGAGWNATIDRRTSANELWGRETVAADVIRLHGTLERISEWQTGVKDELAVVILWPEESALGWELLTYGAAEHSGSLDMLAAPPMLIARYAEQEGVIIPIQLTDVYRGQAFAMVEWRAWSGWPPDLIGWLLYREGPVERGRVVLWVRSDILVPEEGAEP
jgi:hypothetical protein